MNSKSAMRWLVAIGVWSSITSAAMAQELHKTLKDIEVGERWSYDDWDSAKAAAAKSKKPILALFR